MRLYFSGVASTAEAEWLHAAGVQTVLVDQFDLTKPVITYGQFKRVAVDSGAYKALKQPRLKLSVTVDAYAGRFGEDNTETAAAGYYAREFDFIVNADIIGDAAASYNNWRELARRGLVTMPVWHAWSAPLRYLRKYLDEHEGVVGIGALVQPMRAKDEVTLAELHRLADKHPGRFHAFGLNWLKAIEELKDKLASADTSKWLDGGRYGHVIFVNTKTGHLSQAHARRHLGLLLSRAERNIQNARSMEVFCNGRKGVRLD